jgi:hypothetical protein
MPTDEWFKENPKISAYISSDLYQKFEGWMREHNIKKVSRGLTRILEEHLGVVQVEPSLSTPDNSRMEALEGK